MFLTLYALLPLSTAATVPRTVPFSSRLQPVTNRRTLRSTFNDAKHSPLSHSPGPQLELFCPPGCAPRPNALESGAFGSAPRLLSVVPTKFGAGGHVRARPYKSAASQSRFSGRLALHIANSAQLTMLTVYFSMTQWSVKHFSTFSMVSAAIFPWFPLQFRMLIPIPHRPFRSLALEL